MPNIPIQSGANPLANLVSGFMQGFESSRKNAEAEGEHALKIQMLKLQQKKLDAEENLRKLRDQLAGRLEAPQQVTETIGGEAPEQVAPGAMGFTGLSPELAAPSVTTTTEKPAGMRDQLLAQAVREGKIGEVLKPEPKTLAEQLIEIESIKGRGGVPGDLPMQGFTVGGTRPQVRFGQDRVGVGVEAQMFAIKRKMETGTATPEETALYSGWIKETLPAMSGARAGGAETGRMGVRGTPQFQQTERGVATARGTGSAEGRVEVEGRPTTQAVKSQTAESTKSGGLAGERNAPLGERATNYINPTDLTTASPGMTETDAIGKGYRAFKGANGSQFITMARSAQNILDRLEVLSKELLPASTGNTVQDAVNVRKNQVRLFGLSQARDPKVREFNALLASNLAQFAKAAGDAANIAVPEQEFQREALPKTSDTRESALQLLRSKRAILRGVIAGALGIKPLPEAGTSQSQRPRILSITPVGP